MVFPVKTFFSEERESSKVARELVSYFERKGLNLIILFTTERYDHQLIVNEVIKHFRDVKLVGFCAGGVILSDRFSYEGIVAAGIYSRRVKAKTFLISEFAKDVHKAANLAINKLLTNRTSEGLLLILPDGFVSKITTFIRALYEQMGPEFGYIGGGSGDNLKFFKTFQFTEEGIRSQAVALALLKNISYFTAIGHGFLPIGPPLLITRASNKIVYEIDGEPAFRVYRALIEKIFSVQVTAENFASVGLRYPLGIPYFEKDFILRDPLKVLEDESIEFVTEVPEGTIAYIMHTSEDYLLSAARRISTKIKEAVPYPKLVLVFDCISRSVILGERFKEELSLISEILGEKVPIIGALTFGEVGSFANVPLFHNKTIAIGAIDYEE